jgi:hypothetical protein
MDEARTVLSDGAVAIAGARIAAIGLQAAHRGAPAQILEMMLDIYTRKPNPKGLGVELAIRGFARSHRGAASCIARVDDARLAEVGGLFARLGLPQAEAKARALLFYAFLFGQSLLGGKRRTDAEVENLPCQRVHSLGRKQTVGGERLYPRVRANLVKNSAVVAGTTEQELQITFLVNLSGFLCPSYNCCSVTLLLNTTSSPLLGPLCLALPPVNKSNISPIPPGCPPAPCSNPSSPY